MNRSKLIKTVETGLKKEFKKSDWWPQVQEDVRTRLEWVVNNLDKSGVIFRNAYMSLFKWEHERRKLEGESSNINPMAGYISTILGMKISEETYQCGVLPTRAVLNLYDYIQPNDADVTACMFLCNRVEYLEKIGIIVVQDKSSVTTEEISATFDKDKSVKKKEIKKPKINEETIFWNFQNED